MAIMSDADREAATAEFMQGIPPGVSYGLLKADIRAMVNADDQWVSDNAAANNAALPQPGRGAMSTPEKARLHTIVIKWRYLGGV